jgi:hypothetical protein
LITRILLFEYLEKMFAIGLTALVTK